MMTCLGTMMNDSTKLYNTVQVQKLEAELQLVLETLRPSGDSATCDYIESALCTHNESLQFQTKT